jgi:glycosyltransferase involved in cell wall biosynthesis
LRVLTIGSMYPPHHYGGYELVWQSAVLYLRERGHDVEVLTTDTDTGVTAPDPEWVHRELRWHLRDARFERLTIPQRIATARHNHAALRRRLDALRPDVVAWWPMGGLNLTLLESVRRQGLPGVAFVHDDWLDYGRWADGWGWLFVGRRGVLAPLAERVFRLPARIDFDGAAHYLFGSERTRHYAREHGADIHRTGVEQLGIHPDYLDATPPGDWRWRLLYVGRLDPRKGVDTAVEALRHLPADAELELIGGWDAREETRLRELAAGLGLAARVHFAGHLDRPKIIEAYERADAVVFPVRWEEPWGLVPLEAMGKGRPVVATGRGGSAEYLSDGENCLLFEADDPVSLADAVKRLASDPDLRERLRRTGFEAAAHYTEPRYNEAVERALLKAAAPEGSATETLRPTAVK